MYLERMASVGLIIGAMACLGFFLILVWIHGISLHYLILVAAAVGMALGIRLPAHYQVNAVLLLFSSALAVYAAEAVLVYSSIGLNAVEGAGWLNFPQDATARVGAERLHLEKKKNKTFDARTRLEVVQELRARGVRAYPDVFPAVLFTAGSEYTIKSIFQSQLGEFLPLGGIANATTVFCNESGEYIVYESDEHGFHNPSGLWEDKPVEIVALGDSYAHGVCVASDKGFVAVIRAHYPKTINLGINGDGPLAMLATLKEYGPSLKPSVVLWFYYEGNDLRDLDGREKNSPLLMKYLTSVFSQELLQRQDEIDRSLRNYLEAAMTTARPAPSLGSIAKLQSLRQSVRTLFERRPSREGVSAELIDYLTHSGAPAASEDLVLFQDILAEAQRASSQWGGKMMFIYLPTWERYRFPELASKDRVAVLSMARDLHLPVIDIHSVFAEHPDPLTLFPSRRFAHYNEDGHKLVGAEVVKHLR